MNEKELIEMKIESTNKALANKLEVLVGMLNIELNSLKINKYYKPNSLGMLQRDGNEIDNLCGRIGGLQEALDVLNGEFK